MAVGDTYQLSIVGSFLGQSHYNIQYWRVETQVGLDLGLNIHIAEWEAQFKALYLACLSDVFTLHGYIMKRIFPAIGPLTEAGAAAPTAGDIAGAPAESYVACVSALRSGLATRRGRGRYYLGGQAEVNTEATDGNKFTAAYQAEVNALNAAFLTGYTVAAGGNSQTCRLAVWSKLDNTARQVQQILSSVRPATMRSRKYRGLVGA